MLFERRRELNEDPATRGAKIDALLSKLTALPANKQPHCLEDAYLVTYLRHAKFDVEKAFKRICNMADFMRENPQWTTNLTGEEFQGLYEKGFMTILGGRDREGRLISTLLPMKVR